MDLARLRGRLPLIAFILLAVVCLALIGFACACLTEHPMQAVDRVLSAMAELPPLTEVWSLFAVVLAGAGAAFIVGQQANGRASPAVLQRFLL